MSRNEKQHQFVEPYAKCPVCQMVFNKNCMIQFNGTLVCGVCEGSLPVPSYMTVVPRPEPLFHVGRVQRKGRSSQGPQPGEAVGSVGGHAEASSSAFSVYKSAAQLKEEGAKLRNREAGREKRRQRKEEAQSQERAVLDVLLAASLAVEADSAGGSAASACGSAASAGASAASAGASAASAGASAASVGTLTVPVSAPPRASRPVINSVFFEEEDTNDAGISTHDQERRKKPRTESAGQGGGEAASDTAFSLHDVRVCAKCGKACVDGKCCA
jgi:hypothetical protein